MEVIFSMERKLKLLKAVLLLRRFNRYQSKEEQIAEADKYYSDQEIDEWIEELKKIGRASCRERVCQVV